MSERNTPGVGTEGVEVLAGGLTTPILNESQHYPDIELVSLNARERDVYELGYLMGHADGAAAMRCEVDRANWTADRLYTEMARRPAKPFEPANAKSYADLERIRGNSANADRVDAANRARFAQVTK